MVVFSFLLTGAKDMSPIYVNTGHKDSIAPNSSGTIATYRFKAAQRTSEEFAHTFGTSDRSCKTCHRAEDGWSVTPSHIQERFRRSHGTDPIFLPEDGAVCPDADFSAGVKRHEAYALLLRDGLIRMPFHLPANSEFTAIDWTDPYKCIKFDNPEIGLVSVYRRPLPTTNLSYLTSIMWDGSKHDLQSQALEAIELHEQAAKQPTPKQLQEIVDFEGVSYTAQVSDNRAGDDFVG